MARSSDINQRIVLTGAEEVRRHLEEIGKAGERSGNQVRANLLAASQGANSFAAGARSAGQSSGQMRFALQNLSFQVNDVATSLASGGDVMRVFAQQGGQIFQVFQQGGGFGVVMRAAGAGIASMITPMTVAAAAAVALGVGLAVVISRAVSAQSAAREFDVILKGVGKTGSTTGAALEEAGKRLRDVGLNTEEARKAISQAARDGIKPAEIERIIRIGVDLNAVLGEGSLEKFIAAAGEGGPALEAFGKKLGIIPKVASDTSKLLDAAAESTRKFSQSIAAQFASRNRSIADEERTLALQIADLTRKRGTAKEEIELASERRILEIHRASTLALSEIFAARNIENAKNLAEYNKQVEDAAQKAANSGAALIAQIEARVKGLANEALTPGQLAMRELGLAWNDMLDALSKSEVIMALIRDFTALIKVITEALRLMREARILSGAAPLDLTSAAATEAFSGNYASGGLVHGPGTGTSDSIGARLSNGEYVVNALATRMNLPLLHALNSLNRPVMPQMRMPRGFASGGMVAAGIGGGAPVNIHIGGRSFALMGDKQVVGALTRAARRSAMLSAGKLPSAA